MKYTTPSGREFIKMLKSLVDLPHARIRSVTIHAPHDGAVTMEIDCFVTDMTTPLSIKQTGSSGKTKRYEVIVKELD
jgi:hypothetical protein